MKRSLLLVAKYFFLLIIGSIVGVFIYVQFFSNINLVAGNKLSFNKYSLVKGLTESVLLILLLMGSFLTIHTIKFSKESNASLIVYICLFFFTWFLVLPLVITGCNKLNLTFEKQLKAIKSPPLNEGYFRKLNGKLYYFITPEINNNLTVLEYDLNTDELKFENLNLSSNSEYKNNVKPFTDSLVKNNLQNIPYRILNIFNKIKEDMICRWSKGFLSWLVFSTIGFALWSVYAFIKVSSWKLINYFLITILQGIIFLLNGINFPSNAEFIYNFFPNIKGISSSEFAIAFINLVIGIVFILIGVVVRIIKEKRKLR